MKLYHPRLNKDVEFGNVFCAPGALGFDGEGYRFHQYWKHFGMDWSGTTFVAKTITYPPNSGNMPFRLGTNQVASTEFVPRCIVVKPFSGHVLNAVRLSNPGIVWFIDRGAWTRQRKPFCLSFMSLAPTSKERMQELFAFVSLLRPHLKGVSAPMALQLNFACPSSGHDFTELYLEITEALDVAQTLEIPIIPNFNPLVPIEVVKKAARHPATSALWIANTIPWGTPGIDWKNIFGSRESPLIKRGFQQAGGLSGPACLSFTVAKIEEIRKAGVMVPVVAGNGIQSKTGVYDLKNSGAKAIAIGTVAIVRPYRMQSIIRAAQGIF